MAVFSNDLRRVFPFFNLHFSLSSTPRFLYLASFRPFRLVRNVVSFGNFCFIFRGLTLRPSFLVSDELALLLTMCHTSSHSPSQPSTLLPLSISTLNPPPTLHQKPSTLHPLFIKNCARCTFRGSCSLPRSGSLHRTPFSPPAPASV